MIGETVETFMKNNPNFMRSSKDGISYIIPKNIAPSCKSLSFLTLLIDIIDDIEYISKKVIQSLEGFEADLGCITAWQSCKVDSDCCTGCTCKGNQWSKQCFPTTGGGTCGGSGPGGGPTPKPAETSGFIMSSDLKNYITTNSKKNGTAAPTKVTSYLLLLGGGKGYDSTDKKYRRMGTLYNLHKFLESSKANKTMPIDRLVIGFFRPDVNYKDILQSSSFIVKEDDGNVVPGGALGIHTEFDDDAGNKDGGYTELQKMIQELKTFKGPGGEKIQVYLSMGGWNFNCHPQLYLNSFGQGDGKTSPDVADRTNEWGFKCEPRNAMGECSGNPKVCPAIQKKSYTFFYDPDAYKAYIGDGSYATADKITRLAVATAPGVQTLAGASARPGPGPSPSASGDYWYSLGDSNLTDWRYPAFIGGDSQKAGPDVSINEQDVVGVKCHACFLNPIHTVYEPFVQLAAQLGADGVDFDYEEFWHGDTFKALVKNGGDLLLTKHKFARTSAVFRAAVNNINSSGKNLGLSVPSGVVAMWPGTWWYGNLKGLMLGGSNQQVTDPGDVDPAKLSPYKDIFDMMNAKSWNDIYDSIMPMTYDMGGGTGKHECGGDGSPAGGPKGCSISEQVAWYVKNTYEQYQTEIHVGFEIGRPAFPQLGKVDSCTSLDYQLPLTKDQFGQSSWFTSPVIKGGFYWELFKDIVTDPRGLQGGDDNKCVGTGAKCDPNGYGGTINGNDVAIGICKNFYPKADCSWKGVPDNYTYDGTKKYWDAKTKQLGPKPGQGQTESVNTFYPDSVKQGPMPNYNNCPCDFATTCLADPAFTFPKDGIYGANAIRGLGAGGAGALERQYKGELDALQQSQGDSPVLRDGTPDAPPGYAY